jgi:hypothetical protein
MRRSKLSVGITMTAIIRLSKFADLWMHFRTMYLETGATSSEPDPAKQGTPNDGNIFIEPTTCPYPVPDLTTKAVQSTRSAATQGSTLDSSIEKGSMGVGKPSTGSVQAPSTTSANEQKLYGVNPVSSNVELSVTIQSLLQEGTVH